MAKTPKRRTALAKSSGTPTTPEKLVVAHRVGARPIGAALTRHPLVFSKDAKFCFCVQDSSVRVLAVKTGLTVGVLAGHTQRVTSVAINPSNEFQLLSSSLDGTVRAWDFVDAVCLRKWDIGRPIYNLIPVPAISSTVVLVFSQGSGLPLPTAAGGIPKKPAHAPPAAWSVVPFQLDTNRLHDEKALTLKSQVLPSPSVRHATLVVTDGNNLHLWHLDRGLHETLHHTQQITACSVHPRDGVIAIGDTSGKITNIYCISALNIDGEGSKDLTDAEASGSGSAPAATLDIEVVKQVTLENPIVSVRHWHSHAVTALHHCSDDSYLLSGGSEGVLVQWQQQKEDNKPEFLPRLGGAILHISSSPEADLYGVCCSDNSVVLISSASRKEVWRVRGLAAASSPAVAQSFGRTGIVVDPLSNCLVANDLEGTGSLQLFDMLSNSHAATVPITLQNFVAKQVHAHQSLGAPLQPARFHALVDKVAFSSDGSILSTLDYHRGVQKLKFWHRTSPPEGSSDQLGAGSTAFFALNTVVDAPHTRDVTCMAYHPSRHEVATTSKEGKCKIWECRALSSEADTGSGSLPTASGSTVGNTADKTPKQKDSGSGNGGRLLWRCRSTCEYRGLPASAVAFAEDGSLLAIAFGSNVTLWNPHTNTLLHVLPHQPSSERVRHVGFLRGSSPFLVACSARQVCVWNLLTLTLWWSHTDLPAITAFALHPTQPRFSLALKLKRGESTAPLSAGVGEGKNQAKGQQKKRKRAGTSRCSSAPVSDNGNLSSSASPDNALFSGIILSFTADDRTPDMSRSMEHGCAIQAINYVKSPLPAAEAATARSESVLSDGNDLGHGQRYHLVVSDVEGRILDGRSESFGQQESGRNEAAAAASAGITAGNFSSIFGLNAGASAARRRAAQQEELQKKALQQLTNSSGAGSKKLASLLDTPSHIVAAPSTLFAALMQTLIRRPSNIPVAAADKASSVNRKSKTAQTTTALARACSEGERKSKPAVLPLEVTLKNDARNLDSSNLLQALMAAGK
eukprot:INCI14384.3.p1 GENE.INCI14384.3~~INCI14384.3.p1  ORF type:complete len:1025 (+),score=154.79 INCI14384.3:243-3317(+)